MSSLYLLKNKYSPTAEVSFIAWYTIRAEANPFVRKKICSLWWHKPQLVRLRQFTQ